MSAILKTILAFVVAAVFAISATPTMASSSSSSIGGPADYNEAGVNSTFHPTRVSSVITEATFLIPNYSVFGTIDDKGPRAVAVKV